MGKIQGYLTSKAAGAARVPRRAGGEVLHGVLLQVPLPPEVLPLGMLRLPVAAGTEPRCWKVKGDA